MNKMLPERKLTLKIEDEDGYTCKVVYQDIIGESPYDILKKCFNFIKLQGGHISSTFDEYIRGISQAE